MSRDSSVALPRSTIGLSAVFDCGISYSLNIFAIKEKKRREKVSLVSFLHAYVPMHKSRGAQVSISECKFEQLNHLPYSPDMSPSD